MSRIAKKPIIIPSGVSVKIEENALFVSGPKGVLKKALPPEITIELKNNRLWVKIRDIKDGFQRSLVGTYARLIDNMIIGVTTGFEKRLELVGTGFKAQLSDKALVLYLGFSHPVNFQIPENIQIVVEKNIVTVKGLDKQLVGEVAAQIRRLKRPEPYKGIGVRYLGEIVRKKAGKKAVTTT